MARSAMKWSCIVLCLLATGGRCGGQKGGEVVSDLCLTCLCEASSQCDLKSRCVNDVCGPFRMTRGYWIGGGSLGEGWETCAMDVKCAADTVRGYMRRYRKDCDGDGQVDCQDYARIHKMGANGCVKEPDDSIRQFKRNLDTCLEEINASVLSVPQ